MATMPPATLWARMDLPSPALTKHGKHRKEDSGKSTAPLKGTGILATNLCIRKTTA